MFTGVCVIYQLSSHFTIELELEPRIPDSLYCFSWPYLLLLFSGNHLYSKPEYFSLDPWFLKSSSQTGSMSVTWELGDMPDLGPHPTPTESSSLVLGLHACWRLGATVVGGDLKVIPSIMECCPDPQHLFTRFAYCLTLCWGWDGGVLWHVRCALCP